METNYFKDHKQKYIGFTVTAIFIVFVTYVVYKSEALSLPFPPDQERRLPMSRNCPPRVLRFLNRLPPNHPCAQSVSTPVQIPVPNQTNVIDVFAASSESSTPPVDVSATSSAPSTPAADASVEAVSTEEVSPETISVERASTSTSSSSNE